MVYQCICDPSQKLWSSLPLFLCVYSVNFVVTGHILSISYLSEKAAFKNFDSQDLNELKNKWAKKTKQKKTKTKQNKTNQRQKEMKIERP